MEPATKLESLSSYNDRYILSWQDDGYSYHVWINRDKKPGHDVERHNYLGVIYKNQLLPVLEKPNPCKTRLLDLGAKKWAWVRNRIEALTSAEFDSADKLCVQREQEDEARRKAEAEESALTKMHEIAERYGYICTKVSDEVAA
ncbi:MAG: hypothetical protein AAF468_22280 [Pseudomonadota bacterium]